MLARGFRICWFSSATDPVPRRDGAALELVAVKTSNIVERLTQLPYPLWTPAALPRLWREIGRAQIVHVHEHLYGSSIVAILLAKLRRRPVVVTQHMGALGLGSRAFTAVYECGARLLGTLLFPPVARTVFISRNVLEFFGRERSPRAQLIFNGVDVHRFTPVADGERASIRAALGLPPGAPVVLFVGRFVRKKGLHRVLALAQRFPHVQWVLVGSGPEQPQQPPANVHVAGRVEHDRLPQYYRAADLLILPSSGEGMPLVVQEALCCGAGILSTDEVASACPEAADLIRSHPVPRAGDDRPDGTRRCALRSRTAATGGACRTRGAGACLVVPERCVAQYDDVFHQLVAEAS
ncbi:glycosyltransferase family 4 protein [Ramlibacter terrae]|uniref:Glycosyltransferase family 4 protein n=1 Tax=Ramlibacter terrae TaxID=2732511 RepID=A0ABX6P6C7_9BURK|nr:glycosyltransferase family 4 protein [Ramlibacter terrae]